MITQLGILSLTCEDLVLDLDLETSNLDLDLEHFFLVTRLVFSTLSRKNITQRNVNKYLHKAKAVILSIIVKTLQKFEIMELVLLKF